MRKGLVRRKMVKSRFSTILPSAIPFCRAWLSKLRNGVLLYEMIIKRGESS